MTQITRRRVPLGSPLFPNRPPLSPEEIARRKAEDEVFAQRCREIFKRVYPELVTEHYNWYIHIEPESGDYFIDPDEEGDRKPWQNNCDLWELIQKDCCKQRRISCLE